MNYTYKMTYIHYNLGGIRDLVAFLSDHDS